MDFSRNRQQRLDQMMENSAPSQWLPRACLLLATILWGSSFIALKIAFRAYDPMVVIFGRMLIASLCFAFIRRRAVLSWPLLRSGLGLLLFMGLCEPCLYFLFEARALVNTTASQAGLITAMLPLMVGFSARLVLKEALARKTLLGFGLAIGGAAWLSLAARPTAGAPAPLWGNFLEFLAMVCATGYTIALKQLSVRYSPIALSGMQALMGTLFYLPIVLLPGVALPVHTDLLPLGAIFYLGAVVTMGAYTLYNFGVSRIPASQAAAFINLIPVVTAFLGWLILDERFTAVQYLAAALVLGGVYLTQDVAPGGWRRMLGRVRRRQK